MNDYYWMHKAVVGSLYYGEEETRVFASLRLIALYLDLFYSTLSAEYFYTLLNELDELEEDEDEEPNYDFGLGRDDIDWMI